MVTRIRISSPEITGKVSPLCMEANFNLNEDVLKSLAGSYETEGSPVVVANDVWGNDLYREGVAKYRRKMSL